MNLPRPATYDDLLQVPPPFRVELVDGELWVSPRPSSPHANTSLDMAGDLRVRFSRRGPPGGWWVLMEPELHLGSPDPKTLVLVSDLAGWRRERMPLLPSVAAFTLAPDWVAEVLSPGLERRDRIRKTDLYARLGIPWFWIVDPLEETLEVFELREGVYGRVQAFDGPTVVRARPFDAVELDMTTWWMPKEEPAPPSAEPAPGYPP